MYPVHRPARTTPRPGRVRFVVHPQRHRQQVWGLGFEIQSDSIASGNSDLPEETTSVPHDLLPHERERFCDEMLKGFRYCRLAGGLYWRGTDPTGRYLQPRWEGQLAELRDMLDRAGVEGVQLEYWSPPPFWKANRRLCGNPWDTPKDTTNLLRCFGPAFPGDADYRGDVERFLADYAQACRRDVETLQEAGIGVSMWGLANEPQANTAYASCRQTPAQWARTFNAVAPAIRAHDRSIRIVADSAHDRLTYLAALLEAYPERHDCLDAITVHTIGFDSASVVKTVRRARETIPLDRPIFQNEYEYLRGPTSPDRCLNTVQNIMNWFQLARSPSWFWIHALKPVGNEEASGYSLGYWMPAKGRPDRDVPDSLADLAPGQWTWNPGNWHALAGFLRHMPWDSTVVDVEEEGFDDDLRVLAFLRPDGRLVVVLSNRSGGEVRVDVATGRCGGRFIGRRFTPHDPGEGFAGQAIGERVGDLSVDLADRSWEFWIEEQGHAG
jgi:O-glycosyl hydrolase